MKSLKLKVLMSHMHQTLPEWPNSLVDEIRQTLIDSGRTLVVLDDDPTGTQTVHDVPVLTSFAEDDIRCLVETKPPVFFLLTNSRALTESQTKTLHTELAERLRNVASQTGRRLEVISRSDSTLRGHYPLETDTIAEVWPEHADLTLVMPFFAEGGRLTVEGQHYVCDGDTMTPADQTPFANDPVFAYQNSYLPAWVEEKTAGRNAADSVVSISLHDIRTGGPEKVTEMLDGAPTNAVVVVDAATDQDAYVVAAAVGRSTRKVMARVAASYVRARAGLSKQPLLTAKKLQAQGQGGLVVVGSHVPKTTAQLAYLRSKMPDLVAFELSIDSIQESPEDAVAEMSAQVNQRLAENKDVVFFTSRNLKTGVSDAENLKIANMVSKCVSDIVGNLLTRPRYLIGKGGITSSDIATKSLHIKLARVMGSILPGIPVWRAGDESRFPGLQFVVFPGNVGDDTALFEAVKKLRAI